MLTGILEWPSRTEGVFVSTVRLREPRSKTIRSFRCISVKSFLLRDGLRVEVEVEMKKPRRRRRGKNSRGSSGPRNPRPVVERFVSIEGMTPEEFANRKKFEDLTSIGS